MCKVKLFCCSALVAAASLHGMARAEPLTMGYLSRPGFAEMKDGKPAGAFLPLAVAAAAKAGVQADWQALPQKRLIDQVRQDMPNYCAVGIYRTPEREGFAKFSAPFYRDQRFVVASTAANQAAVKAYPSFAALADDAGLKLGGIDGFSYGVELDARIKAMAGRVDLAVVTPDKLVAKLGAGRIDYLLAAPEELDISIKASGLDPAQVGRVAFSDIPDGAQRHFMCGKSVDDAVIAKLSAGIAASAGGAE